MKQITYKAATKLAATSVKQVLAAVGNEHLDLVRGHGYWYFIYDDVAKGRYDTKSVYVVLLRQLSIDQWAAEGREFVTELESK
jgi:hypothetical protein